MIDGAFEHFIAKLSLGEPSSCEKNSDIIVKDIDEILTDEYLNQFNNDKDEYSKFCDQVFKEMIDERRRIKSRPIKVEKPKKDKSKQLTPRIKNSLDSVSSKKKSKRRDQGSRIKASPSKSLGHMDTNDNIEEVILDN